MAYRNEYRYKGGTRRARESKRTKKILRIVGWTALWLFVGMFITHLIFSVVSKVKTEFSELDAIGVPPILTIQDVANSEENSVLYYDGNIADSFELDSFIALAKEKKAQSVMLDLKPESGILAYRSEVSEAKRLFAVPETAATLESILVKFSNADLKVIARISLYTDDLYAVANPRDAARESYTSTVPVTDENGQETTEEKTEITETLWLDSQKHAWTSPYDEDYREYVGKLISEIAAAGVDAILLDNVFFPTEADGNDGSVIFEGAQDSEVPAAGVVRTNVSYLKSIASAGGSRLFVAADARIVCGEQDALAGATFNIFELDADGICPIFMPSRLTADGVTSIAELQFESGETVDVPTLFDALVSRAKLIQGAIDSPPALIPIIQAYTDTSLPASSRREWTSADLFAELDALNKGGIRGRIIYGTRESYEELLVLPEVPPPDQEASGTETPEN